MRRSGTKSPRVVAKKAQKTDRVNLRTAMRQPADAPTRAFVARRLGKSVGAVRFQEGKALHPWQDAEGVWRFDPAEVEALAAKLQVAGRTDAPRIEPSAGKLAASAFRLLREGKSVVDVVIELEQPVEIVQTLDRAFMEHSQSMRLSPPIVERLAIVCEVDKLTPEILLQVLETNSRRLAEMSAARHGAGLSGPESPRKARS